LYSYVVNNVGSNRFCDDVDITLELFSPLVKVLQQVDSDKISMEFFYCDLEKTIKEIKEKFNSNEKKYNPVWNIINKRWKDKLKRPLHRVKHYLNPYIFYKKKTEIEKARIFVNGFVEVMNRFYPNRHETLNKITEQVVYVSISKMLF